MLLRNAVLMFVTFLKLDKSDVNTIVKRCVVVISGSLSDEIKENTPCATGIENKIDWNVCESRAVNELLSSDNEYCKEILPVMKDVVHELTN